MVGMVNMHGVPVVQLDVMGKTCSGIIDTGFNGDLELPEELRTLVNARFLCRNRALLAGGQVVDEDTYLVDFPFDGQTITAEATFVTGDEILIGTHLLTDRRLEIDFPAALVVIERSP